MIGRMGQIRQMKRQNMKTIRSAALGRVLAEMVARGREERTCRICGCTDLNCSGCIKRTGKPCCWKEPDLCSACDDDIEKVKKELMGTRMNVKKREQKEASEKDAMDLKKRFMGVWLDKNRPSMNEIRRILIEQTGLQVNYSTLYQWAHGIKSPEIKHETHS